MAERRAEKARQKVEITPEEMVAISNTIRAQKVTKAERMGQRWWMGIHGGAKILAAAALFAAIGAAKGAEVVIPGLGFIVTPVAHYFAKIGAYGLGAYGAMDIWGAMRMSEAEMDERIMRAKIDAKKIMEVLALKRAQVWATMFMEWKIKRMIKKAQRAQKKAARNAQKAAAA